MNAHDTTPAGHITRRNLAGLLALVLVGGPSLLASDPAAAQASGTAQKIANHFSSVKTMQGENAHQARSFYLGAAFWFGGGFGGGRRPPQNSMRQSLPLPRPKACPLC